MTVYVLQNSSPLSSRVPAIFIAGDFAADPPGPGPELVLDHGCLRKRSAFFLKFIQGHEPFCGHSMQPCFIETSGKTTNASRANMTSKTKSIQEKLRMTMGKPTIIGTNHKGTITGICLLNFSSKRSTGLFRRNFAAMRP